MLVTIVPRLSLPELPEETGELVGYARVSTAEQNLTLQIDALTKAGVSPENLFVEKMSGAKADRPKLRQALKMLRPGWTLVFWKLDRVARSLPHLIRISEQVRDQGSHLRSLTEQIDTKTAIGALYFHMLGAFAQFERDLTIERTKAGMRALKESGVHFGRPLVLTPEKVAKIKADLDAVVRGTKRPRWTVKEIAARNKVSIGTVNNAFPAYRTTKAGANLRGMRQAKPKT